MVIDTNPIKIIEEDEVKLKRGDSDIMQLNTVDDRDNAGNKMITSKNESNKVK